MPDPSQPQNAIVLTPEMLLAHWQGHRDLTRRVIEAFPEDELFSFSAGGMRTFAQLATEVLQMVEPTMKGVTDGIWEGSSYGREGPATKEALLAAWDAAGETLREAWKRIPPARFLEVDSAFGLWTAPIVQTLLYLIDNEVHHRGQGYVYLRMLGITPPAFYERATLTTPKAQG